MEILQQASPGRAKIEPNVYPNNTLIVDLNQCHQNIASLCPLTSAGQASLTSSFRRKCWPFLAKNATTTTETTTTTATAETATTTTTKSGTRSLRLTSEKKKPFNFQIPEPLLRTRAQLSLRDYDKALSVLTSDIRYQLHLLLYRRCQSTWLLLSTIGCILLPLLLTNLESFIILGALLAWIGLQMIGLLATTRFREQLDEMLEKSVAQVNTFFMDHNLMLGVINVGGLLTKTRLVIPMLYFDTFQCREHLESIISFDLRQDTSGDSSKRILDYSKIDLPVQPSHLSANVMALAQSLAKKIVLRYSQRWISHFDKQKLLFTDDQVRPRHLSTGKCLCQFIEEHFSSASKCQPDKYSSKQATSVEHNDTKAIQVINEKQQQIEIPVEAKSIVSSLQAIPATIPTLSELVSCQKRPPYTKIDMDTEPTLAERPQPNGFVSSLAAERQAHSETSRQSGGQMSPVSSAELSLEMEGDLISRSDDLIRKLRLLLELRKNELNCLDGSLFSAMSYKVPQPFFQMPNDIEEERHRIHLKGQDSPEVTVQPSQHEAKKFYNRRDGLFFLSSSGPKKSSQPAANNRSHILEIC